ncbi:MAG: hypothetical protein H6735_13855 [Alphaproteobacteria bacterium]|nr:hypothetical protein [Alphaproteobacteria bacterium]
MVALWLWGCQTDLLGSMGLEPTMSAPDPVAEAPAEPAAEPEAEASAEEAVPAGEPEAGAAPEGEEATPPAPPPVEFNPISTPLGRREGGVRWEGVGTKYEHEEQEIIPSER